MLIEAFQFFVSCFFMFLMRRQHTNTHTMCAHAPLSDPTHNSATTNVRNFSADQVRRLLNRLCSVLQHISNHSLHLQKVLFGWNKPFLDPDPQVALAQTFTSLGTWWELCFQHHLSPIAGRDIKDMLFDSLLTDQSHYVQLQNCVSDTGL